MIKQAIFDSLTDAQVIEIEQKIMNKIDSKANSILRDPNKSISEINTIWDTYNPIISKRRDNLFNAIQRDASMRLNQENYRRIRGLSTGLDNPRFDINYIEHPRLTQRSFEKLVLRNKILDPLHMNKNKIIGAIGAIGATGTAAYKMTRPKPNVLMRNKGLAALAAGALLGGAALVNQKTKE